MEKPRVTIGPFRATKLWNTIVGDFRSGIPLKRHRYRMRYYDNCFSSTEAVEWMHDYLCNSENFGPWVTKTQVILLLDKFLQSKIIEEVKSNKGPTAEKAAFEDNGHLYKFLPVSPMKKLRSALTSRSSIQSLSPSPRTRKTSSRTGRSRLSNSNVHSEDGSSGHSRMDLAKVARPLALRDTNVEIHSQGPTRKVTAKEAPARRLVLRDVNINGQSQENVGQSSSDLPRCRLISRPLTVEQVEEVWKSATLKRLQRLLWLSTLDGLLDDSVIVPSDIVHNCTHLNKNGVVQLLNKDMDLPPWVLSAMKCLANWPNKTDSDLPSYPGFERDVFKTISNYFQSLCEPLITYSRYDLVIEAFVSMECRDRGIVPGQEVVAVHSEDSRGLPSFQSVENLMLNMTMGGRLSSTNTPNMERKNPYARNPGNRKARRSTSFGQVDGQLKSGTPHIPNEGGRMTRGSFNRRYGSVDGISRKSVQEVRNVHTTRAARSNPQRVSNAEDDYGFANMSPASTSSESPLQQAAGVSSLSDQSHNDKTQSNSLHVPPRKCISMTNLQEEGRKPYQAQPKSGGLFSSKKFGSAVELFSKLVKKKSTSQTSLCPNDGEPKKKESHHVTNRHPIISPGLAPPPAYPNYNISPLTAAQKSTADVSCQTQTPDTQQPTNRISPPYPPPLRATLSFSEISSHRNSLTPQTTPSGLPSAILGSAEVTQSTPNLQTSTPMYENLTQKAQAGLKRQDSMLSVTSLYLNNDKSYCLEAMRLCLLLLPAAQRRALHLLLRLMSKMENNPQLVLTTSMSTRDLLLHTFTRSILRCAEEVDLDESLAVRISAYLLDNHSTLFSIPQELREDIEERLTYLKRSQIKYEPDVENAQPAGFCAQVSVEEYERQKAEGSQHAIEDLLDNIIADDQMSSKDKRKKLKLFQKAYPEIYQRRLPNAASEAELFPSRPKIKQPMLNMKRSFSRLKPIR